MAVLTEDQVKLFHRLQMAEIPAFKNINPLTLQKDEAEDILRMNLPALEWIDAVASNDKNEFIERRFIGVTENNCREQMNRWLDDENLTLFQQPNPQFGSGECWNEYFSQPLKSVNLKALTDLFDRWEIQVPQIPIPEDQQTVIRQTANIPAKTVYTRLDSEAAKLELEKLRNGEELSSGVQLGFAPSDRETLQDDSEFFTLYSALKPLSKTELEQVRSGETPEEIIGQAEIANVSSEATRTPYYASLTPEQIREEIEYFQTTGEFKSDITLGYATGARSEKSVEPLVNELTDEEMDLLHENALPDMDKLSGQKLLGFSQSQTVTIYRRLSADELKKELENYAKNGKLSEGVSLGHAPERETHRKAFYKPLIPLSDKEKQIIMSGEKITSQDFLIAQKAVCIAPEIPGKPVFEKKFSALELAFDDCPKSRLEIYMQYRHKADEKELNKITPELRAQIKALQASGKSPKIDRETYLSFTRKDAEAYIKDNEQNPESTFAPTVYQKRAKPKEVAFPDFKKSNLLSKPQADYLQRSILRDLAAEGHICSQKNLNEFFEKIDFITAAQAKDLIEPHLGKPAGYGLLDQCKSYIECGRIVDPQEIKTIKDVHELYMTHKGMDYDKKAVLQDLVDEGYIKGDDAKAKLKFTTEKFDDELIAKYGDAKIGPKLRARLSDLIEDAKIGQIDSDDLAEMSVSKGMEIISHYSDIENFKRQPLATPKQIELLKKMEQRGQIDLRKVDLTTLRFKAADQWIKQNINNPHRSASSQESPATQKQRGLLKLLVKENALKAMPYSEWSKLTIAQASEKIASVPPKQLQTILSKNPAQNQEHAQKRNSMER